MTTTLLDEVLRITRDAATAVRRAYDGDFHVERKEDRTLVTDVDRASHDVIHDGLTALDPGVPIVSEEGDTTLHVPARPHGTFWLVDPIDGTKEVVRGTGEFTIHVGLVLDGRPVLGVVHTPLALRAHSGLLPGAPDLPAGAAPRARRHEPDGSVVPLRTSPAHTGHLRVATSRDHGGPVIAALESGGPPPGVIIRRIGSSLKFCLVAEGAADLYLRDGPTSEWDTAAPQCVVHAAGGIVRDLDGAPLDYGKAGMVNPPFAVVGDPAFDWKAFIDRYGPGRA